MKPKLTASSQHTYDAIFGHPVPRNLHWHEVCSMLNELGQVTEDPNGSVKITCQQHHLVLHPSRNAKGVKIEELMEIRRFLAPKMATPAAGQSTGKHLLVILDHREARIYQTELHGTVPQCITPYDPYGFGRNLHYVQDDSNGQRKPEPKSFYEAIAQTLQGAQSILLFGSGTGESNAMTHLLGELKHHHHEIAEHVVGEITLDQQHNTENQLLALARKFYAQIPPRVVPTA